MTKAEIALELTKLVYPEILKEQRISKTADLDKIITDTYNNIIKDLDCSEQNKD